MKTLVIFSFVIVLGAFGPQRSITSNLEPLWILGMAGIVAFLFHQFCLRLHLAPVAGWLGAGVFLGVGGLKILTPDVSFPMTHALAMVSVWVGFDVGIRMRWQPPMRWSLLISIGVNSSLTGALVAVALVLLLHVPVWVALVFGALASLWGPIFSSANRTADDDALSVSLIGTGVGLAFLTFLLAISYSHGPFGQAALQFAGKLCLSLACGALAGEVIRNLRFFSSRPAVLSVSLTGVAIVAAAVIAQTGLFAVLFGLAAGASLSWSPEISRRSRAVFDTSRPIAFMIFFALIGASIDPFSFIHPRPGFVHIFAIQVAALLVARILFPRLSRYLALGEGHRGWIWIPRGAILFELATHLQTGAASGLLPEPWPQLLRQVVHAEILLHGLLIAPIALAFLPRLQQDDPKPASDPAAAVESS
jgi:Kef-type K+ transport system membrane component KefB